MTQIGKALQVPMAPARRPSRAAGRRGCRRQVCTLWALVLMALYLIGGGVGASNRACAQQVAPSPMFHHDPQHTGRSPFIGPATGTLRWRYQTAYSVNSSPAVGPDDTICIGGFVTNSYDGYVYALNPDGTLRWSYQTGSVTSSSPALGADGTVYVEAE